MTDLLLNFIVIAIFLVFGATIFVLLKQKRKRDEDSLIKFAKQNGWKIEQSRKPLEKSFKITSREWTLESIARSEGREAGPGSTNWEMKTTWFTSRPGSTILIGPRKTRLDIDKHAEKLINQIMTVVLGKGADGLREVNIGSAKFMEHYLVMAQDEERVNTFLTPKLQYALLNWTKRPLLIKRTSSGITIELKGENLKTPDQIQSFILLGEQTI